MASSAPESFENPWESASNDHAYSSSQSGDDQQQSSGEVPQESAATSARLDWHEESGIINGRNFSAIHDNDHDRRQRQHRHHHDTWCQILSIRQMLNMMDVTVTLSLLVFVGYNVDQSRDNNNKKPLAQIVVLVMSAVVAVMIVMRGLLLSILFPNKRCSKSCSTHLTLLLCVTFSTLALSGWIILSKNKDGSVPWCWSVGKWCNGAPKAVPVCVTVLALLEALRFIFAQGKLTQFDQDHPSHQSQVTATTGEEDDPYATPRRHRPWWWNRHNSVSRVDGDERMRESLLGNNGQPRWSSSGNQSYLMNDGVGGTPRSFLGSLFGGRRSDSSNPRDDGSVDYESLNEEWASRTEEDPYWWTREENNQQSVD